MKFRKFFKSPTLGAVAIALAAVLTAGGSASAGPDIFVSLRTGTGPDDRIPGESADPDHPGWIEVRALATGGDHGGSTVSRRRVPQLLDFVLVKEADKSTPKLQEALFTGEVFPEMVVKYPLDGVHPGVIVFLHEVSVTRYEFRARSGAEDPRPVESVAFSYNRIEWIYRPSPLLGGADGATRFDALFGIGDPDRDDDDDGISNLLDSDDDNDGIDDDYELAHGLHPLVADSQYDDDGDSRDNYREYVEGTAADSAASRYSIHSLSIDREGRVIVKIPTIGGRTYRLNSSFTGRKGDWRRLDEFTTPEGAPPELAEVELQPGAASLAPHMLFNVEVDLPGGSNPDDPGLPPDIGPGEPIDPEFPDFPLAPDPLAPGAPIAPLQESLHTQ